MSKGPYQIRKRDDEPILEFCVQGPPITFQTRTRNGKERLKAWKARVSQAALAHMGADRKPMLDDVDVCPAEFSDMRRIDRDNLAKAMLDAMQGIVYVNDRQVHLRSEWCNINGLYEVRFMSPVVARAMSEGYEFVWVVIGLHRPRQVLR